jgi:hypothetical protein
LDALEESKSVYFENVAHARRVFDHVWAGGSSGTRAPFPESYYVKLAHPDGAREVIDAVQGMAGVKNAMGMDRFLGMNAT